MNGHTVWVHIKLTLFLEKMPRENSRLILVKEARRFGWMTSTAKERKQIYLTAAELPWGAITVATRRTQE